MNGRSFLEYLSNPSLIPKKERASFGILKALVGQAVGLVGNYSYTDLKPEYYTDAEKIIQEFNSQYQNTGNFNARDEWEKERKIRNQERRETAQKIALFCRKDIPALRQEALIEKSLGNRETLSDEEENQLREIGVRKEGKLTSVPELLFGSTSDLWDELPLEAAAAGEEIYTYRISDGDLLELSFTDEKPSLVNRSQASIIVGLHKDNSDEILVSPPLPAGSRFILPKESPAIDPKKIRFRIVD